MIMVPNMGSLNFRLFGQHCSWVSFPDHLSYFTPKCLRNLFVQTGFKIVHTHTERGRGANCFLALFLALVSASGQKEHLKEQIGGVSDMEKAGLTVLLKRLVIRGCWFFYLVTYPLWWIVNKIGMGEELFIVGRKPDVSG